MRRSMFYTKYISSRTSRRP